MTFILPPFFSSSPHKELDAQLEGKEENTTRKDEAIGGGGGAAFGKSPQENQRLNEKGILRNNA